MGLITEIVRGGHASALCFCGLPVANFRAFLVAKNRDDALGILSRHFDRFLKRCGVKIEITGPRPISETGYVLCYNESSFVDVAAFCAVMWPYVDRAAAADLYAYFPFGRVSAGKADIELIPRGNRAETEKLMAKMVKKVKSGERLAWGGEGRIVGWDGVSRFKVGASLIAIRSGAPILPVAFCGGHHVMPFGSLRAKPGKVRIHFGEPISTDGLTENDARDLADRVQAVVSEMYAELRPANGNT